MEVLLKLATMKGYDENAKQELLSFSDSSGKLNSTLCVKWSNEKGDIVTLGYVDKDDIKRLGRSL